MKPYLDHLAIAVNSITESRKIFEDLGFEFEKETEVVASQGVEVAFAKLDTHAKVELLEPMKEEGVIFDYIQKKGQGLHHVSFRVEDIALTCQKLKEKGHRLIYQRPVDGAGNCLVNFIHPKSANGVLVEISQKKPV